MKKEKTLYRKIGDIFWENVRNEIEERDLTLAQFERELGLTRLYITQATNAGNLPRSIIIEKIAKYLELDYYVLFIDEANDSYSL